MQGIKSVFIDVTKTNLNAEVNKNVGRRTDRGTDRPSLIHKPELFCNLANK